MLADIRALTVAGSSWANVFFENIQGIGAVRKSETRTKYQAFNDPTLHAPFLSAVRQNVLPRDVCDVLNLKNVAHCEQRLACRKSIIRMTLGEVLQNLNYRISYW